MCVHRWILGTNGSPKRPLTMRTTAVGDDVDWRWSSQLVSSSNVLRSWKVARSWICASMFIWLLLTEPSSQTIGRISRSSWLAFAERLPIWVTKIHMWSQNKQNTSKHGYLILKKMSQRPNIRNWLTKSIEWKTYYLVQSEHSDWWIDSLIIDALTIIRRCLCSLKTNEGDRYSLRTPLTRTSTHREKTNSLSMIQWGPMWK